MASKQNILFFCSYISHFLDCSDGNYGERFAAAQLYFYHHFHPGLVFSTRFGGDFFKEVAERIKNNQEIRAEDGKPLGEYDVNFNKWLKSVQ